MAILATEKVLTLDYWKPAHKLRVGDYVFDKDGRVVRIKLVQEYKASECYEVTFNDHLAMRGDQHLGFPVETPKYRKRTFEYKGVHKFRRPLLPLKVKELQELPLRTKHNRSAYSVPTTKPLELPHQDLPVPPFVFGLWFFGRRADKTLSPARGTGERVREIFKDHGYKIRDHKLQSNGERTFSVTPAVESQLLPIIPKQIPDNYLLASIEQRTQLLQGILYSSKPRYYKKTDEFTISSRHFSIISRIQGLVESLGHRTSVEHNEQRNYYALTFKSRYRLVDEQVSPRLRVHNARRFITKIEPIASQSCIHIETTGEDNTILVGEGYISTC
jgi:replicative DNA helicase